jgi:hypothetical protein
MKKIYLAVSFLVVAFFLGISIVHNALDTEVLNRNIASISSEKIFQFKNDLSIFEELNNKVKITTLSDKKEKVIALNGFSSQLCKSYGKIELTFKAHGVFVAGEPPTFKVIADCLPAQDPAEIALIKIPYEKLLNEKSRTASFKFSEYKETFELLNADSDWAHTWILSEINFVGDSDTKYVKASLKTQEQSVVLEF